LHSIPSYLVVIAHNDWLQGLKETENLEPLLAFCIWGYCMPAHHPLAPADVLEDKRWRFEKLQDERLRLASLVTASNTFRCVAQSSKGNHRDQKLVVSMGSSKDQTIHVEEEWQFISSVSETPQAGPSLRETGKLVKVDLQDWLCLHIEMPQQANPLVLRLTNDADGVTISQSTLYPARYTQEGGPRGRQPPQLPGLEPWVHLGSGEMARASLKEFASGFELCLNASKINIFSAELAPRLGSAQFYLFAMLVDYLHCKDHVGNDMPGSPGSAALDRHNVLVDLLHCVFAKASIQMVEFALGYLHDLKLPAGLEAKLFSAPDTVEQMTLVERACTLDIRSASDDHTSNLNGISKRALLRLLESSRWEAAEGGLLPSPANLLRLRRAGFEHKYGSAVHVACSAARCGLFLRTICGLFLRLFLRDSCVSVGDIDMCFKRVVEYR